jgi:acetate kinase
MGTRSGDIDHSIVFYMVNTLGYSLEDVNNLLLKAECWDLPVLVI